MHRQGDIYYMDKIFLMWPMLVYVVLSEVAANKDTQLKRMQFNTTTVLQ